MAEEEPSHAGEVDDDVREIVHALSHGDVEGAGAALGELGQDIKSEILARDSYAPVFILVLVVVALTPLTEHNIWIQVPTTCLALLTVVLALRRSYIKPRRIRQLTVLAIITAAMIIGTNLFVFISGNEHRFLLAVSAFFTCIIIGIAIPSMLARVFTERRVTLNVLAGALAAYLLVGLWFASLFGLMSALSTDQESRESSFFAQTTHPAAVDFEYFSFITITTVGYGDLTPGNNGARTGAISEAVLGQVFLVTVVARVVSSLGMERVAQGSLRRTPEERGGPPPRP